jgi:TetR/AcrR family transcriptional regulator, mexJK operon transcriptional repressor
MTNSAHMANYAQLRHSVGRPRRGTELLREQALIDAATRVFLHGGYVSSSIQKVASEAGVSTRTIYERFRNKGELLSAVVSNLVEKDLTSMSAAELNRLSVKDALLAIGKTLTARIASPTVSSLLRLLVTECRRFPKLALEMRARTKDRIDNAVEQYFRVQVEAGTLVLSDPAKAASLFTQMICGELKDGILFGTAPEVSEIQVHRHVAFAVEFFLRSAKSPAATRTNKKRP